MMKLVDVRKVMRIGKSYSFIVPTQILDSLRLSSNLFYVHLKDKSLVYTQDTPSKYFVKLRKVSRYRDRSYYALTIPIEYADILGIRQGDSLLIYLDGNSIVVAVGQ